MSEIKEYWQSRPADGNHGVDSYVNKDVDAESLLFDEILTLLPEEPSILEIGCNTGEGLKC